MGQARQWAVRAQQVIANVRGLEPDRICVHRYTGVADFDALGDASANYVPGVVPVADSPGTWLAFVFSKPSFGERDLDVHVFEPSDRPAELWLKLKRQQPIAETFQLSVVGSEGAASAVQRLLTPEAECEPDHVCASGPEWLGTELEREPAAGKQRVRCPVTVTPLDAPARFAGMFYLKLWLPALLACALLAVGCAHTVTRAHEPRSCGCDGGTDHVVKPAAAPRTILPAPPPAEREILPAPPRQDRKIVPAPPPAQST